MNLIISTASGPTTDEQAVIIVTTTMPANGVEIPANQVVFDKPLEPGVPLAVSVEPGQFLTVTTYRS